MKTKRSRNVLAVSLLLITFALSPSVTRAGIIVGFGQDQNPTPCTEKTSDTKSRTSFDRGIIVGLTGIIVGLTGIIVGYSDSNSTCGHIPTGD